MEMYVFQSTIQKPRVYHPLTFLKVEPVAFPEDRLPLVNRSKGVLCHDKLARLENGKGDVATNFEIFHQLHCLVRPAPQRFLKLEKIMYL